MRRFLTIATTMTLVLSMLAAPGSVAQTTRSSNSNRNTSTSTSSSRSSGTTRSSSVSQQNTNHSSGSSATRSSSVSQQNNTRSSSSSSATRSSGSTSSTRSSSVSQQNTNRSSGSSATRSSGVSQQSSSRSSSSATRSSSVSSSSSSRSSNVSSSSSSSRSSSVSSSSSSSRSGNVTSTTRSSGSSAATGGTVRSSNVNRDGLGTSGSEAVRETYRDNGGNYRYQDDFRIDNNHNVTRVAPRHREPMAWDRPGHFWGDHPHYYGYRVHSLPPQWRRISHWGIDYYFYNGIYYRNYGGVYVVCRPPFGTPLEAAINRAILRSIRFAYYVDTYRTYSRTFDYYNNIARQNLIIAQQNARLAAQRSAYALNSNRALSAYELAERLGLVQSYAYANSEYFYLDGVFYTVSPSGSYSTIIPPAGALVTSLPDDYEVIVMNGVEYYLVDNTVYRTTLFEGQPYLEVLGQMYGSLYSQYNIYR